jgi:hypothetical protein
MRGLPSEAVSLSDGEITIDAALLAPKLGLSPEVLMAEMRRGLVYSVAENGVDEDEGRKRLTFRYRSRAWVVVVEANGSLVEGTPPIRRHEPLSLIDLVRDAS